MIASKTDLYACGHKVYIPSPRTSPRTGLDSRPQSRRHNRSTFSDDTSFGQTSKTHRHMSPLYTHLQELGKNLEFSDDVITEVSPHLLSYAKSKKSIRSLFCPNNLGILTPHSRPTREPIGRHDCRGEIKRHLPCLSSPGVRDRDLTSLPKTDGVGSKLSEIDCKLHEQHLGKTKRLTNTRVYMAPSTKSVLWEDETLGKVSSYTARRLSGKHSTVSVDILPSRSKPAFVQEQESVVKNASSSLFSNVLSQSDMEQSVSPPPRDFLSELQDGARPVHQKIADQTKIILDSDGKFDTVIEDLFPYPPNHWSETKETGKSEKRINNVQGYRRWLDFPQPCQTSEDLLWQCQDVSALVSESDSSEIDETNYIPEEASLSKTPCENKEFFDIMHDWCSKWQIHLQPKDIAEQSTILSDLGSLCETTRMIAVASLSLLAEQQAVSKLKASPSNASIHSNSENELSIVSAEMVEGLQKRLEDAAEHVRVPSAITLYCLNRQNKKTNEVLLLSVGGASHVESWASVQCLSLGGVATVAVIEELLRHLTDQPESICRRASELLTSLSAKTTLVHSLAAERLNCSGWLERLAACLLLFKLHGGINKDVCQKLVHLAWNDWSPEVRTGAAQALGHTGHGKMIHDEIGRRLHNDELGEIVRLDALKKLESLGLMTSQLLPSYLSCFNDNHTSIRLQAVRIAGALKLTHPKVRDALLSLLTHDLAWKVKVSTLQAIAECGLRDDGLVSQLVWVIRFERFGSIRAEGCRTIARLGLREDKVIKTLRDLLTVEEDPDVKSEVTLTLEQLGYYKHPEDDMMEMIRSEVKRLGTQERITAEVMSSDRARTTQRVIEWSIRPPLTTRDILNDASGKRSRRVKQKLPQTTEGQETTHSATNKSPFTLQSPSGQSDHCSPKADEHQNSIISNLKHSPTGSLNATCTADSKIELQAMNLRTGAANSSEPQAKSQAKVSRTTSDNSSVVQSLAKNSNQRPLTL